MQDRASSTSRVCHRCFEQPSRKRRCDGSASGSAELIATEVAAVVDRNLLTHDRPVSAIMKLLQFMMSVNSASTFIIPVKASGYRERIVPRSAKHLVGLSCRQHYGKCCSLEQREQHAVQSFRTSRHCIHDQFRQEHFFFFFFFSLLLSFMLGLDTGLCINSCVRTTPLFLLLFQWNSRGDTKQFSWICSQHSNNMYVVWFL